MTGSLLAREPRWEHAQALVCSESALEPRARRGEPRLFPAVVALKRIFCELVKRPTFERLIVDQMPRPINQSSLLPTRPREEVFLIDWASRERGLTPEFGAQIFRPGALPGEPSGMEKGGEEIEG